MWETHEWTMWGSWLASIWGWFKFGFTRWFGLNIIPGDVCPFCGRPYKFKMQPDSWFPICLEIREEWRYIQCYSIPIYSNEPLGGKHTNTLIPVIPKTNPQLCGLVHIVLHIWGLCGRYLIWDGRDHSQHILSKYHYPPIIQQSYWNSPEIVDLPFANYDFSIFFI